MVSDAGPLVLAIDTTAEQCAVALLQGDRACRRAEPMKRGHAERLFEMIEAVLGEAGADFADIDRLVCCTGPGSFAGTRIGVAAVRGLALSTGAEAVGISRFEALAAEAREGRANAVGVALAGRGGTFFQSFDREGAPTGPPRVIGDDREPPDEIEVLAGNGLTRWRGERRLHDGLVDPVVLARLGAARGAEAPPAPLYLRPPSADLPREAPPTVLD